MNNIDKKPLQKSPSLQKQNDGEGEGGDLYHLQRRSSVEVN